MVVASPIVMQQSKQTTPLFATHDKYTGLFYRLVCYLCFGGMWFCVTACDWPTWLSVCPCKTARVMLKTSYRLANNAKPINIKGKRSLSYIICLEESATGYERIVYPLLHRYTALVLGFEANVEPSYLLLFVPRRAP